jgi:DNA-binding MarR family transcriptional regulator
MADIDELAQDITDSCIALRVRQLNRVITSIYEEELRTHSLTIAQLNILALVAQYEIITPQTIGVELRIEKSTLSRGLDRMVRNGWLDGSYSEGGRLQSVKLSKSGEKLLKKASVGWASAQEQVEEALGKRNMKNLFAAVTKVVGEGAE